MSSILDEARKLFELLQVEIEGLFAKAEDIRIQNAEAGRLKLDLQQKVGEVNKTQTQISQDKESALKERAYAQKLMAQSEAKLREVEAKKEELKGQEEKLEVERQEVKRSKEEAQLIIFKAEGIEEKLRELNYQQQLVEKEKAIDRERKEMLDIREEKIARRENQLQIQSEI